MIKKICLFLSVSMHMHGLHASIKIITMTLLLPFCSLPRQKIKKYKKIKIKISKCKCWNWKV